MMLNEQNPEYSVNMKERWLLVIEYTGHIKIYHLKFNFKKILNPLQYYDTEFERRLENYVFKYCDCDSNCDWWLLNKKPIIDKIDQIIEEKYLEE